MVAPTLLTRRLKLRDHMYLVLEAGIGDTSGEHCLAAWGDRGIFLPLPTNKTLKIPTFQVPPDCKLRCPLRDVTASEKFCRDFPDGAVVKNQPANAGGRGSSPGLGRSHMPRSN